MASYMTRLRIAGLCLCALAAACNVEPVTHKVSNGTAQTIDLYSLWPDGGTHLVYDGLAPGKFFPINSWGDECFNVIVIARVSGTATEIARRSGVFCPDDEWTVTE